MRLLLLSLLGRSFLGGPLLGGLLLFGSSLLGGLLLFGRSLLGSSLLGCLLRRLLASCFLGSSLPGRCLLGSSFLLGHCTSSVNKGSASPSEDSPAHAGQPLLANETNTTSEPFGTAGCWTVFHTHSNHQHRGNPFLKVMLYASSRKMQHGFEGIVYKLSKFVKCWQVVLRKYGLSIQSPCAAQGQ